MTCQTGGGNSTDDRPDNENRRSNPPLHSEERNENTERDGGYEGTTWNTAIARGLDKNIRTWGRAGLSGEWSAKPVHVYGDNLRYHIPRTFERLVFRGDKWNEHLHEYANYKNVNGTNTTVL